MNYCGIDLALKSSAICVKTQNNKVLKEIEVPTDEDGFRQGLKSYKRLTIVLEVSPLAEWVANILETLGHEAIIIDARKAKALIKTKKKTDKIDAQKLADMARTGWYTAVHRKRGEARLFRTKLKARQGLLQAHRSQQARIRGLLRSHGIRVGRVGHGQFAARVRQLVSSHEPALSSFIDALLTVWQTVRKELAQVTQQIKRQARTDALCRRLMSIPGVGVLTAITFIATVDDPSRFKRADQVAAYFGLVPSIEQSGESKRLGRITKEGDGLMRSLLVEGGHTLLSCYKKPSSLTQWGRRLKEKKGHGKAKVALARKLAVLLYTVWVTGETYQDRALNRV